MEHLQPVDGILEPTRDAARASTRGARPQGRPAAKVGWDSLTGGELRISMLVAEGLTNQQIATRLFLSRHTVDSHMKHIFLKLQVASRVMLTREVFAHHPEVMPTLSLGGGDHVCGLHVGPDARYQMLLPFVRAGLEAGDKCLIALDEPDPRPLFSRLGRPGEVERRLRTGQLEVVTSTDRVRQEGDPLTPTEMLDFWDGLMQAALHQGGFSSVRLGGDASWWLPQLPGVEDLIRYESGLNRFTTRYPQSVLCLYDVSRHGARVVEDLVKVHPRVLIGGCEVHTAHYVPPDEFLARR
jgi:DNA-binding CsgD family transcriptional regulator